MQLRPPASGARVGEDGSSLLDCADPCRGNMPPGAASRESLPYSIAYGRPEEIYQ